jgi:hypothetical protein
VYAAENRAHVASQVAKVTLENPSTAKKFHSLCTKISNLEAAEVEAKLYLEYLLLACSFQFRLI